MSSATRKPTRVTVERSDPAPGADYRARLYAAYVTTGQATVNASRATATLAVDIVQRLPYSRDARVLDIGCGGGALMEEIHTAGYSHVVGVDVSEEQVAIARGRGLNVISEDVIQWLSTTTEKFEAVVAVDFFEHFAPGDVLHALDLVHAVLSPGGCVVIRTPNAEGPFGSRYRYSDLTHGLAFTARSMRQVLSATGFTGVTVYPTRPVGHGLRSRLRARLWIVIEAFLRLYLLVELGSARDAVLTQNLIAVASRAPNGSDQ